MILRRFAFRTDAPAQTPGEPPVRDGRGRMLLWAALAALVTGALGLGLPLEDYYRMARNKLRLHAPSGQVVVIGLDDQSLERFGSWPWPRSRHAELTQQLKAAGARNIVFDVFFNSPAEPHQNRALADAFRDAGNVTVAATYSRDAITRERRAKLPLPMFRKVARTASVTVSYSSLISVRQVPYAMRYGREVLPSVSAFLGGRSGKEGETFPIDGAIDISKVPIISAAAVLDRPADRLNLRGKDVVVAAISREIGDIFYLPGWGPVNGGIILVMGAETLKQGRPVDLGWFLPFFAGLALASAHLFARRRWLGRSAMAVAVFGCTALPVLSESRLIFYDVVPALLLVGTVAVSRAWSNFRRSYKVRGNFNATSGLPNLNALREEKISADAALVAARIRNFAEISSALPDEAERALVQQIVARLALGARGARIHQGDEGIFMWATSPDAAGGDQLDALHALFRSPALLDGRQIDLSVTFGVDNDGTRNLANRIGATLVAADEAALEGLRWKAYDSAKLADAEWKLSLLGRLDAAIDSGEVWVAYQPQLDLTSDRLCGAEALVRWSHPEKGEVSPMEFVLAAEQHNRIDKLTEFVLTDAIRTAAGFAARGIHFDVAVNISARLLEKPGLTDLVRRLLADAGLPAERLTLEVTESAAMTSGRASIRTLEEIGSLGINVSIDDYGTGFSTLEYFKRIPATEVKIDRSFVASIDRNASDRLMVGSTIELAHSLGRTVVAEGVETEEILSRLRELGCDKVQGYLIGRPMKLMSLSKLFMKGTRVRAA